MEGLRSSNEMNKDPLSNNFSKVADKWHYDQDLTDAELSHASTYRVQYFKTWESMLAFDK